MGSDIQICSCQSDHAECLIAFVSRRKSLAWRPFTAVSFTFATVRVFHCFNVTWIDYVIVFDKWISIIYE